MHTVRFAGKTLFGILAIFFLGVSCTKVQKVSAPAHADLLPVWGNQIIYQVMVDRFYSEKIAQGKFDSDDMNQYQGGTLDGVTQKLDYIKSLGATAILLNPITDSSEYHGYAVKNLMEVNPHFGTLSDYKKLIVEAHRRGMKVLFDFVANHESGQSENLKTHPDWFRPIENTKALNDPDLNEVWTKTTFFGLRDLKQEKEEVYQHLLKAAKFWVDVGVDGFRMDAGSLISPEFFDRFRNDVKSYAGDRFLVMAELYFDNIERYNSYAPFLDGAFDFRIFFLITNILKFHHDPRYFKIVMDEDRLVNNPRLLSFTFIDNHDLSRFVAMTALHDRERLLKLALTMLFTLRGVPSILYGTELAFDNEPQLYKSEFDKSRRRMIFDHNENQPTFKYIQLLAELRKSFDFNSQDKNFILDGTRESLVAFVVRNPDHQARLMIYNLSGVERSVQLNLNYALGVPKNVSLPNLLGDAGALIIKDGFAPLHLGAYQAAVYKIEKF